MDLSRDQGLRTLNLTSWSNHLDLSNEYKRSNEHVMVFLILYVDDILLIKNDVGTLLSVKVWLSGQFDMKDLGEASHILGIKLLRDR